MGGIQWVHLGQHHKQFRRYICRVYKMGNSCIKPVDDVDHLKNKLEHLKMEEAATLYYIRRGDNLEPLTVYVPERRLSDNGAQYEPRKEVTVEEFRKSFQTGSPFH